MTDHFQPNAGTAPQTVFHGSRVVVETPRILPSRCTKDFGPGFCCTLLREQAEEVSGD
ncbi:MAG: DUF3990 domain-containing protein [Kiritimatiellae bacterium]|nr:DUF3990 domain-containing protein [Kiritimatiellia bacterium]MBR4251037.1 DUF3990 domain-containing protein [Kiritimatiellia bacterium]